MPGDTIKVSGRCPEDDISSCVFRLRKVGETVKAQGYRELADAIESLVEAVVRPRRRGPARAAENPGPHTRPLPKVVYLYKNAITKHYVDKEICQARSFRVLKPEPGVLVSMCCAKGDSVKAGRCHPRPTIHKTIVPRTEKYERELEHLRLVHPEVRVVDKGAERGVQAREDDQEAQELAEAIQSAEATA